MVFVFISTVCTGLDFSGDGKFMALAERRNCKDYISVFACDTWQMLKVFG